MKKITLIALLLLTHNVYAETAKDKKLWPMEEHTIPLYVDERTGFVDSNVKTIIALANTTYSKEDRKIIIEYCREYVITRFAAGNLSKNFSEGLLDTLKLEFQYCSVGSIKNWEADAASAEKEPGF